MAKERSEIPVSDRWNVEALYSSFEVWEKDLKEWGREGQQPHWPEIAAFKGKLGGSAESLRKAIDLCIDLDRHLSKLYTYAHLRHDEDVADDAHKKAYTRITALLYEFRQETSWMEPEILAISDKKMGEFLHSEVLKDYRLHLERIIRLKAHTLSADMEELLAQAGVALGTSHKAFSAFNNADLKFPSVPDAGGVLRELTHGKYLFYMRDNDRTLRENAFKAVHKSFLSYENTVCELINGQVQKHVFDMRARKYNSCLEAALFPHEVDPKVYSSLIQSVRSRLGSMHRYMALRKQLLGYAELHLWDLHIPLVPEASLSMDYPAAEKLVIESVAPLGKEYQSILDKGLVSERWVDRYENARKRSGAYSSGCYDSNPYILMNYQGAFHDVMTLAHEAGHSMHSYMSRTHQPYQYSQYPIFLAEVASTFNEELLIGHLMEKCVDAKQKAFLINQQIEDIRTTFFRQTMFAEFELKLHEWAEKGIPITPLLLKTEYRKLNQDYFGPDVCINQEIDIEWARIPHFYYNFYVYQYATGISAAHALVEKVRKEGEGARKKYLHFLSSGCSAPPLDILRAAGVDMLKPDAVDSTIRYFDELVQQLAHLMFSEDPKAVKKTIAVKCTQ